MININASTAIGGSGLEGMGNLSGLDLITAIQVLLVKDYDSQLRHAGKQMKLAGEVKKLYREDMEALQKLLTKERIGDDKDMIAIDDNERALLQTTSSHIANPFAGPGEASVNSKTDDPDHSFDDLTGKNEVKADRVDEKIEIISSKLDTVNEQSELMNLKIQSLTNQRKISFETISNVVRKEADTLGSIVRNLVG